MLRSYTIIMIEKVLQLGCLVCGGGFESDNMYSHMSLYTGINPEATIVMVNSENLQTIFHDKMNRVLRAYVNELASHGIVTDVIIGDPFGEYLEC